MGQSLVKNYIHIVFSTKYRQPLIQPYFENELHAYLGGICKSLDCPVLAVGGYTDHVHILTMLSKNIPLAELLQKLKANSSKWIKSKHPSLDEFYWQNGYGAFSVNPKQVGIVIRYIQNQKAHHTKKDFKTEYYSLLKQHEVSFDERYVWD
ncbi:IS200/IS605 family transposase [Lewinella sp. LCG006]|uniref:IS200/IS605 family transposase n=1 Tax=Lewinella sp. LCG006 TaxID=3231911 RepID=UPI00345F4302